MDRPATGVGPKYYALKEHNQNAKLNEDIERSSDESVDELRRQLNTCRRDKETAENEMQALQVRVVDLQQKLDSVRHRPPFTLIDLKGDDTDWTLRSDTDIRASVYQTNGRRLPTTVRKEAKSKKNYSKQSMAKEVDVLNEIDQRPGMREVIQMTELFKKVMYFYGLFFVFIVLWSILGEFWKDVEQYFLLLILYLLLIAIGALALAALLVYRAFPEANEYIDRVIRVSCKQFLVNYGFCLVMFGVSTVISGQGTRQEYINFCSLLIPEVVVLVLAYIMIKCVQQPRKVDERDRNLEEIFLSLFGFYLIDLCRVIIVGIVGNFCAIAFFKDNKKLITNLELIIERIRPALFVPSFLAMFLLAIVHQTNRVPTTIRKFVHKLPVARMGVFEENVKASEAIRKGPLRKDEHAPARAQAFGNPYKLDKKNMAIDEVGEGSPVSSSSKEAREERKNPQDGRSPKRKAEPLSLNAMQMWRDKRKTLSTCSSVVSDMSFTSDLDDKDLPSSSKSKVNGFSNLHIGNGNGSDLSQSAIKKTWKTTGD